MEDCYYLVLELAQEASVFDLVVEIEGSPFSEDLAAVLFRQLLEGLHAIHLAGYCHRDLKSENILVDKDFNIKIADFGFATQIN